MAEIQEIAAVHRQATFETNRLKLQRGSLDLPIIDSIEEEKKTTFLVKENKLDNKKATEKESLGLRKDVEIKRKNQNETLVANNQVETSKTHNTGETVTDKNEKGKRVEFKPKVQIATEQQPKKTSTSVQDTKKGKGGKTDKQEAVKDAEVKVKNQSNADAISKSSPRVPVSKEDAGKSGKTVEPKKVTKKESVLSKLNSNKNSKADSLTTGEEPAGINRTSNVKSRDKSPEKGPSGDTKNKSTIDTRPSKSTSHQDKNLLKKGSSNDKNNHERDNLNQNVINGQTVSPRNKRGVVLIDKEKVKESNKNSENLPNTNQKSDQGHRPDEKQSKASVLNGLNSKRNKSPERKPIHQQPVKSHEQSTAANLPTEVKGLSSIYTGKTIKTDIVTVDERVDRYQGSSVGKGEHSDEKEPIPKDENKSQSQSKPGVSPYVKPSNTAKTKQHQNTNQERLDLQNNIKQSDKENIENTINESNDQIQNSNYGINSAINNETKTNVDDLPKNKPPKGTSLNDLNDRGANDISIDSKLDYRKDADLPTTEQDYKSDTPNPLIEVINIGQKETTMDGPRHESYEALHAERNTLLKAEVTYKKRIKQLENEANGFLKVIEDLTHENRSLRKKIDMLEDEINADGKTNFVEKIEDAEEQNRTLKALMKEQKEVIDRLKHESTGEGRGHEIRDLKLQIVRLQTDNQNQNYENEKLRAEYQESMKKLNSLKKGNAETDKPKNVTKGNNETDFMKRINTLEYENRALSESLAQKKQELKEILGVMKDENKFDNEIKDLKNELLKLKKEKREQELELAKQKSEFTEKLKETASSFSEKSREYNELKIKCDELESENGRMKKTTETLTETKISLQKELEHMRAEVKRLEKELQESRDMYNKLYTETESASKDLKQTKAELEQFNRDLQTIVADKEGQISKLISQLDALRQEREIEKKMFVEEKDTLMKENERLGVFERNYLKKEKELQSCQERLEESDLKRKQLSITLEDKGFEVSNLQQQIFELNMKMDNYSKRMSQLDKEKREMEIEKRDWEIKKDKVNDIESSNKRLLEENKRLRNQLEMTSLTSERKLSEPVVQKDTGPTEAWVQEKANQQAMYIHKERSKKKVHIIEEHRVSKKRQHYTRSSPVRSTKQPQQKKEVLKVALNSSRSLEDIRKTPERRGSPDSQPSLPEVNKDPRLTFGGGILGGYSQIHRNRIRAANKRVY